MSFEQKLDIVARMDWGGGGGKKRCGETTGEATAQVQTRDNASCNLSSDFWDGEERRKKGVSKYFT